MDRLQTEEGLIGISLRGDQLRMTEAVMRQPAQDHKVLNVSASKISVPFSFEIVEDRSSIPRIADDINRLYETTGFVSAQASLSLDSDFVLIKRVPIDSSLEPEELSEHIEWEFSQMMISPLNNFIIDFERLDRGESATPENHVVAVSVGKTVVDYLREVFAATDLHLQAIDVDVFAAQRVVTELFQYSPEMKVALVDVRKQNLQFSIINNGFSTSQEVNYPADEALESGSNRDDRLARLISKELRRIILDSKLGKSIEDMVQVFIYGDGVSQNILESLSQAHNVGLQILNPFEKIEIIQEKVDSEVTHHPEAFVTSLGAAIKGL